MYGNQLVSRWSGTAGSVIHLILVAALISVPARADIVIPGADGSDGALNVTANTTIDLSEAVSANWDTPSPQPGKGVYDATKWAVVFKYSSLNIANGTTVSFKNHGSRAPVVWLVNGNVTIAGTVNLNGANGIQGSTVLAEPGPGGFRGGAHGSSLATAGGPGFGPGGSNPHSDARGSGGSYATLGKTANIGRLYGNTLIVPLIGGSGGSDQPYIYDIGNGCGGGGAILIAASGTISLTGTITANGGNANESTDGSGGAIRLVATALAGSGRLSALGNDSGGEGRIRLETLSGGADLQMTPLSVIEQASDPVIIWLPETGPQCRIVSIGSNAAPADPRSELGPLPADIRFYSAAPVPVVIETKNVDTSAAKVTLLVRPRHGSGSNLDASYTSGDNNTALWTVELTIPQGYTAFQARVDPK